MSQPPVLEGTWEEIASHADELPEGWRYRLVPLSSASKQEKQNGTAIPNEGMLTALNTIEQRQKDRRSISGEATQEMLRAARAGGLYGFAPTE